MRQFIFSHEMKLEARAIIDALASDERVNLTSVLWVETDSPEVAALLAMLDTAEEIPVQELTPVVPAKPKREYKRKPAAGPLVECPVCHKMRHSEQMTKSGPCKVCHMRELKAQKSQGEEKSQAVPPATEAPIAPTHTAMPPKSEHFQEYWAERLARPKDKINTANLSGRRVG